MMTTELKPYNELKIRLCGGLYAAVGANDIPNLNLRETGFVLSFLALHAERWVKKETLAGLFFDRLEVGDPDHSLRQCISFLRKLLGDHAGIIESRFGEVRIRLGTEQTDIGRLDEACLRGSPEQILAALSETDSPLLSGWDFPWIKPFRERLDQRRVQAQKRLETLLQNEKLSYQTESVEQSAALSQERKEKPVESCNGGVVAPNHPHYIQRRVDAELIDALRRQESTILIKGPRQTGKSSLMARGVAYAREAGWLVLEIDFEQFQAGDFGDSATFYQRLIGNIAEQCDLHYDPAKDWKPILGPAGNFEAFLRRKIFQLTPGLILWALDAVDSLFQTKLYQEFFALIRSFHTKHATQPHLGWNRLTTLISTATEAHLFISDLNQSPFNVGVRLQVKDFSSEELDLIRTRLAPASLSDEEFSAIVELLGSHPYLIARALIEIGNGNGKVSVAQYLAQAQQPHGSFHDHLERIASLIEEDAELREAITAHLKVDAQISERSFFRLRSAGVLKGETQDSVEPRCALYAMFLERRLA